MNGDRGLVTVHSVDLLAYMGTNGQRWAERFVAMHGGDVGLMLAWFANAIEAGRDAGSRAQQDTQVDS